MASRRRSLFSVVRGRFSDCFRIFFWSRRKSHCCQLQGCGQFTILSEPFRQRTRASCRAASSRFCPGPGRASISMWMWKEPVSAHCSLPPSLLPLPPRPSHPRPAGHCRKSFISVTDSSNDDVDGLRLDLDGPRRSPPSDLYFGAERVSRSAVSFSCSLSPSS